MGSGNHVVIDLSSDEEFDPRVDIDYFDWLTQIEEVVDEKSDSTDAVEVVSEVKGGVNSQYRKPNSSTRAVVDKDDDDCVILDGDPDKKAKNSAVFDDEKSGKSHDDDDVLVVGQKGEIACRDFPHPRHSCAKNAFNSTSHEKYCAMCHCYVCDIRAPCQYWSISGVSSDHCHANDKERIWRDQREYFRTRTIPPQPSSKPKTLIPPSLPMPRQVSQPSTQSIWYAQNTLPQNHGGIRPCSSSSNVANLSSGSARYRQSFPHNHNHGLQNRAVQPLRSVRNKVIQKDISSYIKPRMASSGTRYGSTNGNNMGLPTNAQLPQSVHHRSSIPVPPGIYSRHRPNVTNYRSAVTGSQSNAHNTTHPVQNKTGRANCQFQANAHLVARGPTQMVQQQAQMVQQQAQMVQQQAQMVQQQAGTNENMMQTKMLEFESWLMDQTGPGSQSAEPVGEDISLSFDFEELLND